MRVVSITNVTLDGVMQAPGRPDEDTRGGFRHGGWAVPYNAMGSLLGERGEQSGAMLFGRRTYEDFAAFWPKQEPNPYTEALNAMTKYVASTTLREPLPWTNSVLLKSGVPQEVGRLREQEGDDLVILGSGELVRSLMPHRLVDEFILLIHPLVLGTGRRLFADGTAMTPLKLTDSRATDTGVVIAVYQPRS
ncbi:MAG TPA: dihydrofolate reductase family protein [Actinomycetota bacterium]|nr:dihydrofolate reductase family protein [Actinomycetota bacterium]